MPKIDTIGQKTHYPALDGIRGIAAFGVVLYHGHFGDLTNWMWTFVDLFFVLSGFLIGQIIISNALNNSFSLRNFIIRRILRIWPVYYLTYIFCVAVVVIKYIIIGEWTHTAGIISAPFFLQFTDQYLFFPERGPHLPFIVWFHHSWSVAVEEQFYLLLPIIVLCLKRTFLVLVLFVFALIPLAIYFRSLGLFNVLLICRMDALALGVLLAIIFIKRNALFKLDSYSKYDFFVLLLLASGIFLTLINVLKPQNSAELLPASLALFGMNLIFVSVIYLGLRRKLLIIQCILESKPLLFMGSISYALYMFHVPIRGIILNIGDYSLISESPLYWQLSYVLLSIFCAYISRQLIEYPINRFKNNFPMRT